MNHSLIVSFTLWFQNDELIWYSVYLLNGYAKHRLDEMISQRSGTYDDDDDDDDDTFHLGKWWAEYGRSLWTVGALCSAVVFF